MCVDEVTEEVIFIVPTEAAGCRSILLLPLRLQAERKQQQVRMVHPTAAAEFETLPECIGLLAPWSDARPRSVFVFFLIVQRQFYDRPFHQVVNFRHRGAHQEDGANHDRRQLANRPCVRDRRVTFLPELVLPAIHCRRHIKAQVPGHRI